MQKQPLGKFSKMPKISSQNLAYFCWFLASILSSVSFIYPNENMIDTFSSNFSRAVALVFINGIGLYWREIFTSLPSTHASFTWRELGFVCFRNFLMAVYGFGFAESQFYLSAPVCYTIFFSGPLFIMLIDTTYFKFKMSKQQSFGVLLTGFGVLLTANGQALWSWVLNEPQFPTSFENYKSQNFLEKSVICGSMLALTFGWACAQIIVRQLKNKNHFFINFNLGILLTVTSALPLMINSQNVFRFNYTVYGTCVLLQGLPAALAQTLFMIALGLTRRAASMTMIGFVGVLVSYGISVGRYHQPLSLFCVIGALCTLIGIYKTLKQ